MIDPRSRTVLARCLRHLAAGVITTDEFERRVPHNSTDRAVEAIAKAAWFLYDDLREYRLRGRHRLPKSERESVARCILFLASELPYEWPVERASITRGVAHLLGNILTFGVLARRRVRSWRRLPNSDLWPFFRPADYRRSLAHPLFLAGMRPNLSLNPDASPAALTRRPLGAG
jgi:hypothetical protein